MKSICVSAFLSFCCFFSLAQAQTGKGAGATASSATPASSSSASTTSTSSSSQVINFNYRTKLITSSNTVIPFDRRFYFEIDSIPVNGITNIAVYSLRYKGGYGLLTDSVRFHRHPQGGWRSSFEFGPPDTVIGKNIITLHFPALKPEQDFDILITKHFSPNNLKKALALNKILDDPLNRMQNGAALQTLVPPGGKYTTLRDQFQELSDSANNFQYTAKPLQIINFVTLQTGPNQYNPVQDLADYKQYFYDPLATTYASLTSTVAAAGGFSLQNFFDAATIKLIADNAPKDALIHNRLYLLQKIYNDNQSAPVQTIFHDLELGLLTVDYSLPITQTDSYDFATRLKNLAGTYKFIDSLKTALLTIQESNPRAYAPVVNETNSILNDIASNRAFITTQSQAINSFITNNSQEGLWVIGQNTVAQDFQTLGTRKFTIDAGLANIWAYNNNGTFVPILKLVIGFDYYFRSVDKTVDFNYITPPAAPDDYSNGYLQSRRTFWQRFALSVGATLGAMGNKDFDNFYSTFSFTFGGSYVLTKGLKVNAGIALLKRYDTNPLMTSQESTVVGPFVGVLLDYDLLGVIQNFTSEIFK